MYKVDYHLHTEHSMDSQMPLTTLCKAALDAGLNEICLTEHTEFGHPIQETDVPPNMPAWFADIEKAQQMFPNLVIRAGIEIGDNPVTRDRIKAWHLAQPLDFMLLSLHLVDNEDPYFIDFFDGKDQNTLYRRYVESKLESALAWEPAEYDAMAHLGYCAKFAPYPIETRPLRYKHAPDTFDALFKRLAQNGKALEINTSGYARMGESIPGKELLQHFRRAGGEFVTLGSDAHTPEAVAQHLDDARDLAKECGFRYLLTFEKRSPIPVSL